MKSRTSLFIAFSTAALLASGTLLAQTSSNTSTATYQTPQGELVVNSAPAPAPTYGPAPSFEALANGGKAISEEQADAYPPLANDFLNADRNRDGHISKAEYERWVKQS